MGPSVQQLLIVLLIIVLLFGAKKIPELAKGLGKGIKSFKSEMETDDKKAENVEKVEEKKEEAITATKVDETTKSA
ncbi:MULTISPECIES: twin-arginine translocase TatA/TatE family subunit [unclassified Campylobacter]|uniref:twin-arginine translocase TatA/TatE family subunit n=1 Tax=unclassified Campylobacter TaxID=2593542 RepID=UPI0014525285|nr:MULTISPECIES: twin-arginine translocase TatA/TatE family subunit [unclassified Campylobacter]QCD52020.1 twin arginine translocation system, TatA/E family protein [Campylobacter sp. RM16192]